MFNALNLHSKCLNVLIEDYRHGLEQSKQSLFWSFICFTDLMINCARSCTSDLLVDIPGLDIQPPTCESSAQLLLHLWLWLNWPKSILSVQFYPRANTLHRTHNRMEWVLNTWTELSRPFLNNGFCNTHTTLPLYKNDIIKHSMGLLLFESSSDSFS